MAKEYGSFVWPYASLPHVPRGCWEARIKLDTEISNIKEIRVVLNIAMIRYHLITSLLQQNSPPHKSHMDHRDGIEV